MVSMIADSEVVSALVRVPINKRSARALSHNAYCSPGLRHDLCLSSAIQPRLELKREPEGHKCAVRSVRR